MNRIFLRFLLPILLTIAVASALVYGLISAIFGDPIEENAIRQAKPQIFLLEQYIDKAPTDEWLIRLNKVREISQVKFDLVPLQEALAKLSRTEQLELNEGKIVINARQQSFYRRVDLDGNRYIGSADDVLVARDLPIEYWLHIKTELLRFAVIALVLLIPIAFWTRSHWRDILTLVKVTEEFGRGQLSVRATISPNASIYPIAHQLNDMAERIEKLVTAQKNLMHAVSHELRTPIARLEFALEILQSDSDKAHPEKFQQRVRAMQGDLKELNTLVSELLQMAKMEESQQLLKQSIPVAVLLEECQQHLPPIPSSIQLVCGSSSPELTCLCDQRLLVRAIVNLLKNAIKYTQDQISLSINTNNEAQLQIVVEDNGLGIPVEEREKIFDPFYRLDRSRDRATGGFGLGLAIVRQIVTLHGGTVKVSASELGGAKFEIRLPVN